MISVLILTKNEQKDLPGCLESVSWCDDVHVLDSGSSDDTCALARALGANVVVKTYPDSRKSFGGDEAAHRNWSLQNTPFKYPWVLLVDADERVTVELVAAIKKAVTLPGDRVAFQVQRRDFFMGTWLKHAQQTPFYLRLFRPEKIRYERLINPVSVVEGPVGSVGGYLDHFPFSKGISHWIERHNSYSSLEASQINGARLAHAKVSLRKALTASDFHERRFHQKEIFYRVPFRPLVKFMFLYFYKRGFLDGKAGTTYALLQAMYEYMIVVKVRELKLAK
ncbi:MAG TPA: glycosyltransferase family 2 protein [Steroidobacteraceae bacterium]|nr:glycosyltransferase family 2 protein [Steroidobacteraceae bacterium]